MRQIHLLAACAAIFAPVGTLFAQSAPSHAGTPGSTLGARVEQPAADVGYVVQFKRRSFDLSALRTAIHARQPAAVTDPIIADYAARAAADQAAFVQRAEALGLRVTQHFWLINGCGLVGPAGLRDAIEALPGVLSVDENGLRHPTSLHPAELHPTPMHAAPIRTATNANNHNADAVQAQGILGAGVTLAMVDTGFDLNMGTTTRPHATFFVNGNPANMSGGGIGGSRMVQSRQIGFHAPDIAASHGTRMAAIAAGETWNTSGQADRGHAPAASIAGYTISVSPGGAAELQTMVAGWQSVVADRVSLGIEVANMSYSGSDDRSQAEQVAMDTAAEVADLIVTVAAGGSSSPSYYHAALNILAVGATDANTRTTPSWSSTGPRPSDQGRYPHVVANGVGIITPEIDNEAINATTSGTSQGAAQVAGAAVLFRSVATSASALETRAAILASLEDVRATVAAEQAGFGYLRDDRLIAIAQGQGLLSTGAVSTSVRAQTFSLPVVANQTYAVAMCFNRQNPAQTQVGDLDLRVMQDGQELAASQSRVDSNEKVWFRARSNSNVQVVVERIALEPGQITQRFAVAGLEAPEAQVSGSIEIVGSGCPGAQQQPLNPGTDTQQFGTSLGSVGASSTNNVFGTGPHRVQMRYAPQFGSVTVRSLGFRFDELVAPGGGDRWIELEIDAGPVPVASLGFPSPTLPLPPLSTNFAANRSTHVVNVLSRQRIVLPGGSTPSTNAGHWDVIIPLDQTFSTFPDLQFGPWGALFIEMRVFATSSGALNYPIDAGTGAHMQMLYASSPTATTGTFMPGIAPALALFVRHPAPLVPTLEGTGSPNDGGSYTLTLDSAASTAPAALVTGFSGTVWSGVPLPFDLGVLGGTGCHLFVSMDEISSLTTNAAGQASLTLPVPPNTSLVNSEVWHQALVLESGVRMLPVTVSNGLRVVIGR